MEHEGEEMKPRCLQGPREVMQSDLHWKLLPAVECTNWSRDLRQMHEPWGKVAMAYVIFLKWKIHRGATGPPSLTSLWQPLPLGQPWPGPVQHHLVYL